MQDMSVKINHTGRIFEKALRVVLWSNSTQHGEEIMHHFQSDIQSPNGSFSKIRYVNTGVYQNESDIKFYYITNRGAIPHSIKFTIRQIPSYTTLDDAELREIDLLLINLSFSDLASELHDESDKYELAPMLHRSSSFQCHKGFIFNLNESLFEQGKMNGIGPGFTAGNLNEKGQRQFRNVYNQLKGYYPRLKKAAAVDKNCAFIFHTTGHHLGDMESIGRFIYLKMLETDKSVISTIKYL